MDEPEEHRHPTLRMHEFAGLSTSHPRSDLGDDWISYSPDDPAGAVRAQPLLAAVGAGFDYCAPCVTRHAAEIAKDPLLLVWLAWGVGVQAGRWRTLPSGEDPERRHYFAARVDPDAAGIVDALYAGDDGLGAALAAARALPEERRADAAKIMVDVLFVHVDTMNMPIGWGELGLLNTGG